MATTGVTASCSILLPTALAKEGPTAKQLLYYHHLHGDSKKCVHYSPGKRYCSLKKPQRLHNRTPTSTTIKFLMPCLDLNSPVSNRQLKTHAAGTLNNMLMKKLSAFVFTIFCFINLSAQKTFLIGGKVVDSATQQPLGGASVFAQNTTQGTTSNADGIFVMRLPNGGYDLIVSYTGYETRSIRISNTQAQGDSIIIMLPQASKTLEE